MALIDDFTQETIDAASASFDAYQAAQVARRGGVALAWADLVAANYDDAHAWCGLESYSAQDLEDACALCVANWTGSHNIGGAPILRWPTKSAVRRLAWVQFWALSVPQRAAGKASWEASVLAKYPALDLAKCPWKAQDIEIRLAHSQP